MLIGAMIGCDRADVMAYLAAAAAAPASPRSKEGLLPDRPPVAGRLAGLDGAKEKPVDATGRPTSPRAVPARFANRPAFQADGPKVPAPSGKVAKGPKIEVARNTNYYRNKALLELKAELGDKWDGLSPTERRDKIHERATALEPAKAKVAAATFDESLINPAEQTGAPVVNRVLADD